MKTIIICINDGEYVLNEGFKTKVVDPKWLVEETKA